MSNFAFLQDSFPDIFEITKDAEDLVFVKPRQALMSCRLSMEKSLEWMFANDEGLTIPETEHNRNPTLNQLLKEQSLKRITTKDQRSKLHLLRDFGNDAVHGREIDTEAPLHQIKVLYDWLKWMALTYEQAQQVPDFDERHIPTGSPQSESTAALEKQLLKESKKVFKLSKAIDEERRKNALLREKNKSVIKISPTASEATTRRLLIDHQLRNAGWTNLKDGKDKEYKVVGMPRETNPKGNGFVDYVLWGDNGKPLAVVEAKKASKRVELGKNQAELYANCLEQMEGQRPLMFFTNGFDIHFWDDQFGTPREVSGFFKKDELQLLVDRRNTRKDIRRFTANPNIAGRPYQLEAIKRVAEHYATLTPTDQLTGRHRRSLLVMATGTGKTRTAISITDMLTKCNWAKRILFLADRTALITQAKKSFNALLPDLSAIDLTKEKDSPETRIVFSTYPTMMNLIDRMSDGGVRTYGAGHFDLVIIDEAHRSVYQKYRAIFEYFDALLLGLTATPRNEVDRDTYSLFELEKNNPTFAYELIQAVQDKWLVPMKSIEVTIKFPSSGIVYDELSDEEKEQYEIKFGDPTLDTDESKTNKIKSSDINKKVFNKDTVDKVLAYLMDNGIKVDCGDKIGKTIIFAKNHHHALYIQERFNKMYPEHQGKFLRVIDNYEPKAEALLEDFKLEKREINPQIAVSVDMMDTGIDAPRVVNLVFFKSVKSSTKFWQMIGRGTRLCKDLFNPGDKEEFLIFDFGGNFSFFSVNPDGFERGVSKPLMQQIFEHKLELALLVQHHDDSTEEDLKLAKKYIDDLHLSIESLDRERFVVQRESRLVNEYSFRRRWDNLTENDVLEINNHLSHLPALLKDNDEGSRRFDNLIFGIALVKLKGGSGKETLINKLKNIAIQLNKKINIPEVEAQQEHINAILVEGFGSNISLTNLEKIRLGLRHLIKHLDRAQKQKIVYTDFEDSIDHDGVRISSPLSTYTDLTAYKERVQKYVRDNAHHKSIQKLTTNQPITQEDINHLEGILFVEGLAENLEKFHKAFGEVPLGEFIRSILGMDKEEVQKAFASFITQQNLLPNQITFINTIIDYIARNGVLKPAMLTKTPFTDIHDQGLFGLFEEEHLQREIVHLIREVNSNALV